MDSSSTPVGHPHLTRRATAVSAGLACFGAWITIYASLWDAHIPQNWLHHMILLALGVASFSLPCVGVWVLARGYDRARTFRGF